MIRPFKPPPHRSRARSAAIAVARIDAPDTFSASPELAVRPNCLHMARDCWPQALRVGHSKSSLTTRGTLRISMASGFVPDVPCDGQWAMVLSVSKTRCLESTYV